MVTAIVAAVAVAACASSGAASPAGPARSAPPSGPAAPTVASAEDAAALVVASDVRFEGAIALDPEMIGASKWWEASANDDGSYTVKVTIGWGDCPAGCINQHTWTYRVGRDGALALLDWTRPVNDQVELIDMHRSAVPCETGVCD